MAYGDGRVAFLVSELSLEGCTSRPNDPQGEEALKLRDPKARRYFLAQLAEGGIYCDDKIKAVFD